MSDPIVQRGQVWLNATYGGNPNYSHVEPNGLHGSAMSAALVSAMQIELGTPVSGVFGDITKEACDRSPLKPGDSGNRVKIMQYGFYNKGYNAGTEDGSFNAFTKAVVREIQEDAGLAGSQITDQVDGLRMGAILGVDEYKLVSGGDSKVRWLQQDLNHRYLAYTGLKACDGYYGRSTNQAIIYAIQAEEGMSVDTATGFFGPSTKNYLPDLWQPGQWGMNGNYTKEQIERFTILAKYALYCVGIDRYMGGSGSKYDPGVLDGEQSAFTLNALRAFQKDYGLAQRDMVGLNEWMGMLVSTGNPNRDGEACDCATQLTPSKARAIKGDGYNIVGRYLTGTVGGGADKRNKNLTSEEIQTIFDAGLNLFCIYQDDEDWWQSHNDLSDYFSYDRGYLDASKAISAAHSLLIPEGSCIYFAVDHDFMEGEVWQKVVPHFEGINAYVNQYDAAYSVGIYSARNTCGIVSAQGLASGSFVSDMSTGYSGNLGYPLPSNWAFDQIQEYPLGTSDGSFSIDKNVVSGIDRGVDRIEGPVLKTTLKATTGNINIQSGGTSADAYNVMALKCYGFQTGEVSKYVLATESVANLTAAGTTSVCDAIKEVHIEIIASNGARFDTARSQGGTGNYPPVSNKGFVENFIDGFIASQLVKYVASVMGIRAKIVVMGAQQIAKIIAQFDGSRTESADSGTRLFRSFKWDNPEAQTNQCVTFYPIFPTSGGSFDLTYTVYGRTINGTRSSLSNTIHVDNPA